MRRPTLVRRLALSSTALALVGVGGPVDAATCTWNGGAGDWSNGALWSCGFVPGAGDVVRIDAQPAVASTVNVFNNDQNASTVTLDSGDAIRINNATLSIYGGALDNSGSITISGNGGLRSQSAVTSITGTGTIILDNSNGGAALYGGGANQLSIGVGQTVQGAGQIGIDQGAITNNGLITANVGGATLTLDARGGNGGIGDGSGVGTGGVAGLLNNGTIAATNGGTLTFASGQYQNGANGQIQAVGTGSTVFLGSDSRIVGGTLTSSGGGQIAALNVDQYLNDVTLTTGSVLNLTNDYVHLNNTFTNNGTVTLAINSQLRGDTPTTTIGGTGSIVLDNTVGSAILFGTGANQVTIGGGQTVTGSGQIGIDQGAITNQGVVNANLAGGTITIDARGGRDGNTDGSGVGTNNLAGFLNSNLLEATNGGTLVIGGGLYENTGARIQAVGGGSTVFLGSDSRIVGGTLTSSGGGQIAALNVEQYLNDVTLTTGSVLNLTNDYVHLNNNFTNNGTVTLTTNSQLRADSATTIGGTGSIVLDNTNGDALLFGIGANQVTIGSGQTVTGSGRIGADSGAITNQGIVNANAAGRTITIDARGGRDGNTDGSGNGTNNLAGFLNANLLEATNGGTLVLANGLYENTGARIQAVGGGSTVFLGSDSRIVGGTLTSSGGGQIAALNVDQYLNDVTLTTGSVLNLTNDYVHLNNTFTNNGTVTLTTNSQLRADSATTIGGTGSIVLDNTNGDALLFGIGANQVTIGSGQTVTGSGRIGADSGAITNQGIVNANAAGRTITIDARGGRDGNTDGSGNGTNNLAGFLNANLLEATNGGTLVLANGLYENTGARIQAVGTGSTVFLGSDSRIVGGTLTSSGGGQIAALNVEQYLNDVTLTAGSVLNVNNDFVHLNGSFTNNGTVTLATNSQLRGDTATTTIGGTGSIVLDNSNGSAILFGTGTNQLVIGTGQTVRGSGQIGIDQGAITNRGNILADGAITIDARGGGGGNTDGSGVGTNNLIGFFNDNGGQVQANNGGATLTLTSGLYQNAAGGSFSVGSGSTFNMASDSNLTNLQAGGVLNEGLYFAFAGGTMNLRSDQTGSILTIGTNHAGIDTVVTLSGAGSVLEVTPRNGDTATTIDQSLQSIAQSGELILSNGRTFTAAGGGFTNAGTLALDSGAQFTATGLANSGLVTGNGTLATPVTNSGSVVASGGTLNSLAITGTTGTIQSNAGATLSLAGAGAPSTAGFLVNNGALALGGNDVTVTSDYQNANFGSGSAFNARANVTGTGLILAASATQDLSGPGLTGSTLNVGNVRLGNSSSTTLTITNNGTLTTLRGAVESPASNTVNISSSNFVVGPNGGSTTVTLSYTGNQAGSLQGQTVTVANNFDNVADQTLQITGAAYNPAAASLAPNPVNLGSTRTGGTLSGTVTISNTAPAGAFSESLAVTGTTGSGGASGTAPSGLIAAGASAPSTVMLNTQTSGTKNGTVTYALATDGTGTSGLAQMALPSQSVTVNGKVYQVADPQLASNNVTFATVRQGSTAPTATLGVTNAANGALTDSLSTQVTSTPTGVTAAAPGSLAGGQSGNVTFTENTGTAGMFSGTAQLGFTSTDPDLAPLALPSQSVTVGGTVTQLAVAQLLKNAGSGTFSGAGMTYTLDLGSIMSGSGVLSTDIAVLNAIMNTSYGEKLGGMFGSSGGAGYTFAGMTFSGLAGGSENTGNILTFNSAGLGDGTYTDLLTLTDYSSYTGLADMTLAPIQVNVTARIFGSGGGNPGAVPELDSWVMLIAGFGALGVTLRRRRALVAVAA